MLTDQQFHDAVARAREIAGSYEEPYKTVVFTEILKRLLDMPSRAPVAATGSGGPEVVAALPGSLNEFLAAKAARSHPDRVACIAYYLYRRDGLSMTAKDIAEGYTAARVRRPQNVSDVVGTCVRKGWLVDAERRDGAKAWTITPTGEQYVESLRPRE